MKIVTVRIEDAPTIAPDIVSARALASLDRLLSMCEGWIGHAGGRGLFHKGRDYAAEVDEARVHWQFDLIEHESMIDPMSRVLDISNVRRSENS